MFGRRLLAFCALPLLLGGYLWAYNPAAAAQNKPSPQRKTTPSSAPKVPTPNQDLAQRVAAQQAATQSGDPAQIEAASKKLSASGLREMAGVRAGSGTWTEAIELYRQSLNLEEDKDTRIALAVAYLYGGKPDEGLEEIEKVLITYPAEGRAWQVKGKVALARQDYRTAADSLVRALELDRDVNAEYALALSLLHLKEKDKAAEVFADMLRTYGDRAVWHVVFGGAYRETNYLDEAMREFQRAIELDPKFPHVHYFLGYTSVENNNWGPSPLSKKEYTEEVRQYPTEFDGNLALGVTESELGEVAESNRYLLTASKAQPDNPDVWMYLGLNAYKERDYSNAKTYLRDAIRLTGNDDSRNGYQIKRAYFALSRILASEGNKAEADRYVAKYKELGDKSLEQNSQAVGALMNQGPLASGPAAMAKAGGGQSGDSALSAPAVEQPKLTEGQRKALAAREKQLRTILGSSFNDWGTAEARQKRYGPALAHFQEAAKWDPSTPSVQRNIGLAALRVGDNPEAARAFQAAVQSDPSDRLAQSMLAMTYFSLHRLPEALKAFEAAGDVIYRDPRMAYAYAFALVHSNDPQKGIQVLNQLASQPLPIDLLVGVGDLYNQANDYEDALRIFRQAIQQDPSAPRAHFYAGVSLIHLDRPNEALPEFQSELKASPDDPDVQYYLAYAMLQTSHKEEAIALLTALTAAHPDHAQAQYQLGKALQDEGNNEAAIQHLEAAAKLDPERDYIHYQLQAAYRKVGRTADAESELKVYREMKARQRDKTNPQPKPQ